MVKRELEVIDLTGCEDAEQPIVQIRRLHEDEPDDLLCPITGVMFRDPVVLPASGITFERRAIEEWLSKGNLTCPVTRVEVASDNGVLLTNFTARGSVERWLRENPDRTPEDWNTREMLPPTHPHVDGARERRRRRNEGDVRVLQTLRETCHVVEDTWDTLGRLAKLRLVELTSLPAEIGQLTSLKELGLNEVETSDDEVDNQLSSMPPEIE